MPDYGLKFLPKGNISAALAGISGILIILGIFRLAGFVLKKIILLLVAALTVSSPAFAAHPLVTDDFYTVPQAGNELEVGYASAQNQVSRVNSANLSYKRGIQPYFDLGIEVPYSTGLNDVLLHAKCLLWERGKDEGITGRVDYKFNNGSINQGLGSGDNDYCLMVIYSKMIGRTKTHLNIGYVNVGINAGVQSDDYTAYAFAMEHPLWGEKGDIVAEYVANSAAAPNPAFIQLGARYAVSSGFKINAGYSFGLNNNSIKNNLTAGIHYEF